MKKAFIEILDELTILEKSSSEDYNNKQYAAYEQYITEFNRILTRLKEIGYFSEKQPISFVPDGQKAYMGVGSYEEIAKLREIVDESQKLIAKLKQKRGRIWISSNDKIIKINKSLLLVIIPIFFSIIGGSFFLGKEFGNYKYDKEKNDLVNQNLFLTKTKDSLQIQYDQTNKKYQELFILCELNKKENYKTTKLSELSSQLDDYIGKTNLSEYQYNATKYKDWKDEVSIILEGIDKLDPNIDAVSFFKSKITECEKNSISFTNDYYTCAIPILEQIKLKIKNCA